MHLKNSKKSNKKKEVIKEKQKDGQNVEEEVYYDVESIIEHEIQNDKKKSIAYLVKWEGYGDEENCWQNEVYLLPSCKQLIYNYHYRTSTLKLIQNKKTYQEYFKQKKNQESDTESDLEEEEDQFTLNKNNNEQNLSEKKQEEKQQNLQENNNQEIEQQLQQQQNNEHQSQEMQFQEINNNLNSQEKQNQITQDKDVLQQQLQTTNSNPEIQENLQNEDQIEKKDNLQIERDEEKIQQTEQKDIKQIENNNESQEKQNQVKQNQELSMSSVSLSESENEEVDDSQNVYKPYSENSKIHRQTVSKPKKIQKKQKEYKILDRQMNPKCFSRKYLILDMETNVEKWQMEAYTNKYHKNIKDAYDLKILQQDLENKDQNYNLNQKRQQNDKDLDYYLQEILQKKQKIEQKNQLDTEYKFFNENIGILSKKDIPKQIESIQISDPQDKSKWEFYISWNPRKDGSVPINSLVQYKDLAKDYNLLIEDYIDNYLINIMKSQDQQNQQNFLNFKRQIDQQFQYNMPFTQKQIYHEYKMFIENNQQYL